MRILPTVVLELAVVLVVAGCLRKPPAGQTTPLHEAAKAGDAAKVASLLASGADVSVQDPNAWTALHYGAANGYKDIAAMLLDRGAGVNARATFGYRGPDGAMPLHEAAKGGHAGVVELLIARGADVSA